MTNVCNAVAFQYDSCHSGLRAGIQLNDKVSVGWVERSVTHQKHPINKFEETVVGFATIKS
jgi:hypothetical protein